MGCGVCEVIHRIHSAGYRSRTRSGQKFHGNDLDVPVDARHADVITADTADRAADMRPMAIIIERVVVVVDKIPAD